MATLGDSTGILKRSANYQLSQSHHYPIILSLYWAIKVGSDNVVKFGPEKPVVKLPSTYFEKS